MNVIHFFYNKVKLVTLQIYLDLTLNKIKFLIKYYIVHRVKILFLS